MTTEYAYDEVGNLVKQQTTGKTELSLEYVYDKNNAMVSETRVEQGSSVKTEYTYDQLGQLTSLVKSNGHSEAFAYDKVGNMVGKEFNDAKLTLTYDAANELKTMESVKGKIDYSYDANGNLTSKALGNRVDTYAYDTYNQLTSFKGYDGYQQRYTYNAQGHMVKKESKGNENRLTLEEIVRGDGEKQAATGDGEEDDPDPDPYAGQASSDGWQATTYVYDVTRQYYEVLSETTDGATTAYDYGIERLSAYSGNTWNARKTEYVYDGRGSVVQEVAYNNSWYTLKGRIGKAEVTSYSYSAFGELLQNDTSGYRFNGEAYDSATGMLNLRARQFEPTVGRFSQRDLLRGDASSPLSLNRYTYCHNDPVNFTDFNGLSLASLVSKAKSVVTSVVKAVTTVAKAVVNTVVTVAKAVATTVTTVAKTVASTVQTVVNTVQTVATAAKTGGVKAAVSAAVSGAVTSAAAIANSVSAAQAQIQATIQKSTQEILSFQKDAAGALNTFANETFGVLSERNQEIMSNAMNKIKEMQANGASQAEIAVVFLKACRDIAKNVGETTVAAVKEEIVEPTVNTVVNAANAVAEWVDENKAEIAVGAATVAAGVGIALLTAATLPVSGPLAIAATLAAGGIASGISFNFGNTLMNNLDEYDTFSEAADASAAQTTKQLPAIIVSSVAAGAAGGYASTLTGGALPGLGLGQTAFPDEQTVADDIAEWLGPDARVITNDHGDKVFMSADGMRKFRSDLLWTKPHENPHVHFEEFINGKWVDSTGQIYPYDVPHY